MMKKMYRQSGTFAVAVKTNPLTTEIEFILTDFQPNKNNQAIPLSEAENIIGTAIGMPIKIRFDGSKSGGHMGAVPVGSIQKARLDTDNGKDVIIATAVIWNTEYPEIADYVHRPIAIATSWELFYQHSEYDDNNVEWLHDIIVAASAIVDDPAYGKDRTRLLAVAQLLQEGETVEEEVTTTPEVTSETENTEVVADEAVAEETPTIDYSSLIDFIYQVWDEDVRAENEERAIVSAEAALERLQAIVASYRNKRKDSKAELDTERQKREDTERLNQELVDAKVFAERSLALARAGTQFSEADISDRRAMIMGMSDSAFELYIADFGRFPVATAEAKVKVPNSLGVGAPSIKRLAQMLNGEK